MKKYYFFILSVFFFGSQAIQAQLQQTDFFDFGEDMSSHSYTATGSTSIGAYTCSGGNDLTLRIGNGNSGSSAQVAMTVNAGADSIKLTFAMPWSGGNVRIDVDNAYQATVTSNSCNDYDIIITNFSAYTTDGLVLVTFKDTLASFPGDGQIAFLSVFSNAIGSSIKEYSGNALVTFQSYNDHFRIVLNENISGLRYTISDLLGKEILKRNINSPATEIHTGDFPSGIYFFSIYNNEKEKLYTRKMVVR